MTMMKRAKLLMGVAAIALVFSACDKEDVVENNDNEVITTMELHFMEQGTSNSLIYTFNDADGPGGANPTIDVIRLAPNKVYNVEVVLLDRTKNPVDTITAEVEEEADDHRFYYEPSTGANITVTNLDNDNNGLPVGINSRWTTTGAANGQITVTLRHYESGGKAQNDPVNSTKSSTDAVAVFTTSVQ
jgi:hypothetical protein